MTTTDTAPVPADRRRGGSGAHGQAPHDAGVRGGGRRPDPGPARAHVLTTAARHDGALSLALLDRFELGSPDGPLIGQGWARAKAKAVLKILALAPGRAMHRETLVELLWPDRAPGAGGTQLRKNLHYLRAELARHGWRSPVSVAGDVVRLAADVRVDVDEFRALAAEVRRGDDPAAYERALASVATADLLPEDPFEEWSQEPRRELRALRADLLGDLAELYERSARYADAERLLRRVLREDPVNEVAHRALIEVLVRSGNRGGALRQYQRCREALRAELGIEPSPPTQALYRDVLTGGLASSATPAPERAVLLEELGDVIRRAGDLARCAPLYEEALALLEGDADAVGRVRGKATLAYILGGQMRAAGRLLDAARAAFAAEQPPLVTGRTHYLLAQLRWHSGRYSEALDAAETALAEARRSGDPAQRAQAYEVLALACHAVGDWQRGMAYELQRHELDVVDGFDVDEALESHLCLWEYHLYGDRPYPAVENAVRRTLERAESTGNVRAMAVCQHALGSVHFLTGQWARSADELGRSVRMARSVGAGQGEVIGSQRLGLLQTAAGRLDQAHELLRDTAAIARASRSFQVRHHSVTRTFASLAQNRLQAGDLAAAVGYLDEGTAASRENGECVTCDSLIHPVSVPIRLAIGDLDRAQAACDHAERLALHFAGRGRAAGARHARGLLAAVRGDLPAARRHLAAAAATFDELGQPYDAARSLQALATLPDHRPTDPADDPGRRADMLYRRIGAAPDPDRLDLVLG